MDRMTLAALEATAELYRDHRVARHEIPALRMIHESPSLLKARATRLVEALGDVEGLEVVATHSVVGGGTLPGAEMPSWGVGVGRGDNATELATTLRQGCGGTDPIVARVHEGRVILDLRTVPESRDPDLETALRALLS